MTEHDKEIVMPTPSATPTAGASRRLDLKALLALALVALVTMSMFGWFATDAATGQDEAKDDHLKCSVDVYVWDVTDKANPVPLEGGDVWLESIAENGPEPDKEKTGASGKITFEFDCGGYDVWFAGKPAGYEFMGTRKKPVESGRENGRKGRDIHFYVTRSGTAADESDNHHSDIDPIEEVLISIGEPANGSTTEPATGAESHQPPESQPGTDTVLVGEGSPTESTPQVPTGQVDETVVEDQLVEEIPWEEIPWEEIPWEEIPWEEIPTEEIPWEEIPTEEIPWEEIPTEEIPWEEIPTEEIPHEDTQPNDPFECRTGPCSLPGS